MVLGGFAVYSTWAALQNAHYYAPPYLSPFYSPCISANCDARYLAADRLLVESFSGIFDSCGFPAVFARRATTIAKHITAHFFDRRRPAPCVTPPKSYSGETRFPFVLQNVHRYFFYLSLVILAFLWWDCHSRLQISRTVSVWVVGTIVLLVNAALLSLFSFSCNSCRHVCGGYLNSFHSAPSKFKTWTFISKLNEKHMEYAWVSLIWVGLDRCSTCACLPWA